MTIKFAQFYITSRIFRQTICKIFRGSLFLLLFNWKSSKVHTSLIYFLQKIFLSFAEHDVVCFIPARGILDTLSRKLWGKVQLCWDSIERSKQSTSRKRVVKYNIVICSDKNNVADIVCFFSRWLHYVSSECVLNWIIILRLLDRAIG